MRKLTRFENNNNCATKYVIFSHFFTLLSFDVMCKAFALPTWLSEKFMFISCLNLTFMSTTVLSTGQQVMSTVLYVQVKNSN